MTATTLTTVCCIINFARTRFLLPIRVNYVDRREPGEQVSEVFYGNIYGRRNACADSVYQALFSPPPREQPEARDEANMRYACPLEFCMHETTWATVTSWLLFTNINFFDHV